MKIVATSPGDIVIEFKIPESNSTYIIPVKSVSGNKNIDVSKEYGIGSHQAFAEVVGKIGYEGDFTIGSWYVDSENNPATWDELVKLLTYQNDEGLPREFIINIHARSGEGMTRVGTGTYGAINGYSASTYEDLGETGRITGSANNEAVASMENTDTVIMSFQRCILKGDAVDVPEVGGTVSRRYPFSCLVRTPK
jgi:hypothetical protein